LNKKDKNSIGTSSKAKKKLVLAGINNDNISILCFMIPIKITLIKIVKDKELVQKIITMDYSEDGTKPVKLEIRIVRNKEKIIEKKCIPFTPILSTINEQIIS
jgi:hypothetical protein